MLGQEKLSLFWKSFIRAVESDAREVESIRGASGLSHPVIAVGVDEARHRIIIISGEPDARSAAMAHADIQAAYPTMKVVLARPIPFNLAVIAAFISKEIGKLSLGWDDLQSLAARTSEVTSMLQHEVRSMEKAGLGPLAAVVLPFTYARLDTVAVFKEVIQQLSFVELEQDNQVNFDGANAESAGTKAVFGLRRLFALDPVEMDRRVGICSVPLYELSPADAEVFQSGVDIEHARTILKTQNILQYFFPAPDHLALGLAEQTISTPGTLVDRLLGVPEVGHPFGEPELLSLQDVSQTVEALQEQGLLVEGEAGIEITPAGQSVRAAVRFKPREGLLSKLSNIISVKIELTLKDLFKSS
jgi:hypothetical protein